VEILAGLLQKSHSVVTWCDGVNRFGFMHHDPIQALRHEGAPLLPGP